MLIKLITKWYNIWLTSKNVISSNIMCHCSTIITQWIAVLHRGGWFQKMMGLNWLLKGANTTATGAPQVQCMRSFPVHRNISNIVSSY